ncbi:glycerol kinase 1 [Cellvibrio zantedeschiae]|uniref:Glycerol kinase 1 n=1 Tax=Cellvibrio zantedeschiae TaxID=1237077 RepID=A0ABQ3AV23_9GAMM|nr:FGGY family carbohydrate kinase [Cellvibrio zantedeschiae]GGY68802.1 glycerol kinase 1 [Cellvibrio zantedeschiae]
MTTQSLILAIDQGGQSSRVAVYSASGTQVHCFSAPCATYRKSVDGVEYIEQDPQDILSGIKECLDKIRKLMGEDVKNILAAGFAGQGSSLLCWNNKTGEALSPVLSWQDIRGKDYLDETLLTNSQTQAITGLRMSPHYGASKIRWCLDHNPHVQQTYKNNSLSIGPIVSYIFWHLCSTNLVDPGHAQRTLLWNLQTKTWDQHLLDLFQIPRSVLPTPKLHNSHFGYIDVNNISIPFKASARDQGASLFARGLPDKNACYVNIGTGAFIQRVSEKLIAPEGLLVSPLWIPENTSPKNSVEVSSPVCYAADFASDFQKALYAWEATVNGAASAIDYIEKETNLNITPQQINKSLALAPTRECYFLNAVGGLSAPYWRTDVQSRFSEDLSADEKVLAWLESIIFQIVINVRLMDSLGKTQKIYISGGISNADAICQKLADLLEAPVHRSENTDATLQGIAYLAAGQPELWGSETAEDIFTPAPNAGLSARFQLWQNKLGDWLKN